jgi:hypothetical protein
MQQANIYNPYINLIIQKIIFHLDKFKSTSKKLSIEKKF